MGNRKAVLQSSLFISLLAGNFVAEPDPKAVATSSSGLLRWLRPSPELSATLRASGKARNSGKHSKMPYKRSMGQTEIDKISAALDRAEFALEQLRKKVDEVHRKRASAKKPEEIEALNLETAELWQQLQKISVAVHTGNLAPHLRLLPDTE
jgi:hypothetical protein